MKRYLNLFLSAAMAVMVLAGCEKEENRVIYEGGTAPVLTASRTTTIPLSFANKDMEAIKFMWTNPDYKFTTGLSSQNVTYQLEIDTTGANFTNPAKKVVVISSDLSVTFTQDQLNDYLLNQLVLVAGIPHNIEMRVRSTIGTSAAALYSNVMKYTVTPYAIPPKVAPPASGKLFIVGSATPGGWNNPVPVPSQEFTKLSPTMFEIASLNLVAGQFYLFLPVNGDWGAKYGALGGNGSNNPNGDDFKPGGGDMITPSVGGNYKIQVDFQRGKFTLTKL